VNEPRGFTLAELFVAMFVLSVGIVAVAAALGQATSGVEALEDWSSALLQAGRAVEAYGTIVNAARYRRETIVADHAGRECASGVPSTVACKRVRVTVSYRPVSGGGGPAEERRVDLVTVLVSRAVTPTS